MAAAPYERLPMQLENALMDTYLGAAIERATSQSRSGQKVGEQPAAGSIGGSRVRSGIIRPERPGDHRNPGEYEMQYADGSE